MSVICLHLKRSCSEYLLSAFVEVHLTAHIILIYLLCNILNITNPKDLIGT